MDLNLAEDSSNRLTNKWNRREQAGFTNENVQEYLVDSDKLSSVSRGMFGTGDGVLMLHERHRIWRQTELQQRALRNSVHLDTTAHATRHATRDAGGRVE